MFKLSDLPASLIAAASDVLNAARQKASQEVVAENVAVAVDEIGQNDAVGCRKMTTVPKHCDIVQDEDLATGKCSYRVLVQYSGNGFPQLFPKMHEKGCDSVEELLKMVPPEAMDCTKMAVEKALGVPHKQAPFNGEKK